MENKPFRDMPEAPVPPKLPKYFPDLQGANRGKTPGAGWIENELRPWLREVNSRYGYGIWISLSAIVAIGLGIGIYFYQDAIYQSAQSAMALTVQTKDKILEVTGNVKYKILDVSGQAKDKIVEVSTQTKDQILGLLNSVRERISGLPTSPTTEDADVEIHMPRTMADKLKNIVGMSDD